MEGRVCVCACERVWMLVGWGWGWGLGVLESAGGLGMDKCVREKRLVFDIFV